jgi:lipoprotein
MKKVIYAILIAALATAMLGGCQDVPEPYTNPNENKGGNQEVPEPGTLTGKGTETEPYNVTAALAKIKTMKDGENTGEIFVKGKIRSVKEVDTGNFGNATYFISDDITKKMDSLQIYRSKYLGKAKFTAKDQIKAGDEVVIRGTFVNFKGNTPESEPNKSWIHSLNGKTVEAETLVPGEPKGAGTEAEPYNVTAALAKIKTLGEKDTLRNLYVRGKIRYIKEVNLEKYGSATYYISDDNTKKMDSLNIFGSKFLGNVKFTAKDQIKVGDEVVVVGSFVNHKGNSPGAAGGKTHLYMLNGKKESGGTTPEKPETPQTGKGLSIEGQVVTLTNANAEVGTETVTYEMSKLGNDDIAKVDPINLGGGLTLTVEQSDGQTVPAYFGKYKNLRLYANNIFTITGNKKIAKVVLDCDKFKKDIFVGNATATVSFKDNTITYKNATKESKGVQLRILKITVVYAK